MKREIINEIAESKPNVPKNNKITIKQAERIGMRLYNK